jgi:hypothetical protein
MIHPVSPSLTSLLYSPTAVRCAAHAHRAAETLDENAVSPHRATRAAWCLRGWVHSSVCAVRQSRTRGEGAELAHTRDWPARRACEAQELEHDGEVYSRSCSPGSRLLTLLAFGFLRPDYEDGDRNAHSRKVQKKAGTLGYRREEMDRGRWMERRSCSWSGARANDGGP